MKRIKTLFCTENMRHTQSLYSIIERLPRPLYLEYKGKNLVCSSLGSPTLHVDGKILVIFSSLEAQAHWYLPPLGTIDI